MLVLLWVHPKVGIPTPPATPDPQKLLSLQAQGCSGSEWVMQGLPIPRRKDAEEPRKCSGPCPSPIPARAGPRLCLHSRCRAVTQVALPRQGESDGGVGPALGNAPSTPPSLNKPSGVNQRLHSAQPFHRATRIEIQWLSLFPHLVEQVHGRRARWFLSGTRLVWGPSGWGNSGVMPLTMGWQWGRRQHRLSAGWCWSQPAPLGQPTSRSAANLGTSQQLCNFIIPLISS